MRTTWQAPVCSATLHGGPRACPRSHKHLFRCDDISGMGFLPPSYGLSRQPDAWSPASLQGAPATPHRPLCTLSSQQARERLTGCTVSFLSRGLGEAARFCSPPLCPESAAQKWPQRMTGFLFHCGSVLEHLWNREAWAWASGHQTLRGVPPAGLSAARGQRGGLWPHADGCTFPCGEAHGGVGLLRVLSQCPLACPQHAALF